MSPPRKLSLQACFPFTNSNQLIIVIIFYRDSMPWSKFEITKCLCDLKIRAIPPKSYDSFSFKTMYLYQV